MEQFFSVIFKIGSAFLMVAAGAIIAIGILMWLIKKKIIHEDAAVWIIFIGSVLVYYLSYNI
ncbi:hypothetical protein ACEZNE_002591 [Klebsiella pneumoniae]|uniref:hypothetical protein n=1 Tax=Klebsiella pneumoniae complex TaxID=3390273 RepID=UPI00042723B5|nr:MULTISPECIES: hypothetical protein [Klebsiella]DAL51677.1 MAG TPA_asm: hypothetical protein [Caudoviricetes sp.]HED3411481.1 hypothetical protein [Klebsiella michiganensis]EIW8626767.1 hypothetical protein [Klebsiella pneumoniae]MDX7608337.1 hypothetical protein [Klebsiella quasipneumoniae]PLJ19101.1 hypothetical protein B6J61_19935 [Klebsiella pneumoniae]